MASRFRTSRGTMTDSAPGRPATLPAPAEPPVARGKGPGPPAAGLLGPAVRCPATVRTAAVDAWLPLLRSTSYRSRSGQMRP